MTDVIASRRGDAHQYARLTSAQHCRFRARRGGAGRSPKGGRVGFGPEPRSGLFSEHDLKKKAPAPVATDGLGAPSFDGVLVKMWEEKTPQTPAGAAAPVEGAGDPAAAAKKTAAVVAKKEEKVEKEDKTAPPAAVDSFREMCWTCVQVSRPGMWCASVSCFLFPLCTTARADDPKLWLGLLYFTLPFNLLIMGWNDICDWDVDQYNERKKGRGIWGIRATKKELARLPYWIAAANVPCWLAFVAAGIPAQSVAVWCADALLASFFYNGVQGWERRTPQLSRAPVVDVGMNIWIWFGAFHMGYLVGGGAGAFMLPGLTPEAVAAAPLAAPWFKRDFAFRAVLLMIILARSQLRAALCDYNSDVKAGKATIGTFVGKKNTLRLVLACWFAEGVLLVCEWKAYLIGAGYAVLLVAWLTRSLRIAQMYNITGAFCLWFIAFNWVSAGGATFENAYHEAHIPSGGHQTWW